MIRRRWIVLFLFILISSITTAGAYVAFIDPVYEASTKLLVNQSQTEEGVTQLDLNTINTNILLINTYKEIIYSPITMDKVVELYPQQNLTTEKLIDAVKVTSVNDSQVMTISIEHTSYEVATNIVNSISKVFKEQINEIMNVDNVEILYDARPKDNLQPVNMGLPMSMALSIVLSFILGLGTVFLLEYLDDSVQTEQQITEDLNLQTFCVVPYIRRKDWKIEKDTDAKNQKGVDTPYASIET